MRLSCNLVNVYTIAYRVQYTITRVHARIPNEHPREERVGQVGGQVGEDRRAFPARGKLNGEVAGHADILATISRGSRRECPCRCRRRRMWALGSFRASVQFSFLHFCTA